MTRVPEPPFSLPVKALYVASAAACALAGAGWVLVAVTANLGHRVATVGAVESSLMLLGAWLGLMAVRPGKTRPFHRGVIVWIAAFPAQVIITLGLSLLLYSAAQDSGTALILSFLVAALATLVGQTWVGVSHLKRATADTAAVSLSESTGQ